METKIMQRIKQKRKEKKKKRKEKPDPKLWELKEGTMVAVGENKHIMEFLGIDGMYARRKPAYGEVVIMGHANQKVSEYGEILHHKQ